MLNKISKILIYSLVFLLPLVFAPFTNVLDFPKQEVLIVFVSLAVFLWFLNSVSKGKFRIRFSLFDFLILGFLLILGISTVLSRWPWGSLWGWPQDTADCFLTVFFFAVFYFLIVNLFEEKKEIFLLLLVLIISGALVALLGGLQLFGKFFLPFGFTKVSSFNTIGTFNSWGIFLGALIPLLIGLIFKTKGPVRIGLGILALPIVLGVILSNYWVVWLGILFSMGIFLIFGISRFGSAGSLKQSKLATGQAPQVGKIDSKFLILLMVLFSVSLFLGVFKISIPGLPATPIEVSPSFKATFDVSGQMITSTPDVSSSTSGVWIENIKNLLLGWGPGSFKYGWSRYKSALLNQTIFWNIRFTGGACEILEGLGEIGVIGMIGEIGIMVLALYLGFSGLLKSKKSAGDLVFSLAPFAGFFSVSALKFLYPGNLSLAFLWWIFLAVLMTGIKEKSPEGKPSASYRVKVFEIRTAHFVRDPCYFVIKPGSRTSLFFSFALILVFIGMMVLFYFQGQRFFAELKYGEAQASLVAGDNREATRAILEAISHNPQQEIFYQDLAQIYLAMAQEEMMRSDISDEEKVANVGGLVAAAVNLTKRATDINEANVANWQVRGLVYRSIIGWSEGAFEWAMRSYERAQVLEPTNSFIYVEVGRAHIAQASRLRGGPEMEKALEVAQANIQKAIELKGDYAPAYFQQALIYDLQGKSKEAIATLEAVEASTPFLLGFNPMADVGLAFQLGVLYYREENFDKAKIEFERAVSLSPAYSNARYFLGLIYDKNGETQKAIEQFESIKSFNPENKEVEAILTNLKAGNPALEGIVTTPETVPIEEKPEEK